MKGAEILIEKADDLRKRLARLDSMGYVDHGFVVGLMPKVLEICGEIEAYCATEAESSDN